MEQLQLVKPEHSLLETQAFKTDLQFKSLIERGVLPDTPENRKSLPLKAARLVTDYSSDYVVASRTVLDEYIAHTPCCLFPIIMEILRRL